MNLLECVLRSEIVIPIFTTYSPSESMIHHSLSPYFHRQIAITLGYFRNFPMFHQRKPSRCLSSSASLAAAASFSFSASGLAGTCRPNMLLLPGPLVVSTQTQTI
jgi:hypothetical protein